MDALGIILACSNHRRLSGRVLLELGATFRIMDSVAACANPSMSTVRLDVDDPEDLHRVRQTIRRLGPETETAGYERFVSVWGELEEIAESEPRPD